jgi:hypothetical protein
MQLQLFFYCVIFFWRVFFCVFGSTAQSGDVHSAFDPKHPERYPSRLLQVVGAYKTVRAFQVREDAEDKERKKREKEEKEALKVLLREQRRRIPR